MSTNGGVELENRILAIKGFRGNNCITASKSEVARSPDYGILALSLIEPVSSVDLQGASVILYIVKDERENH